MELTLSKSILPFVLPPGLSLVLAAAALAAFLAGRRRLAAGVATAAVALLWLGAMPHMARALAGPIEARYLPVPVEQSPEAAVAIVLGGGVGPPLPPRLGADIGHAGDRVLHAARLYRAGKVERVLACGGRAAAVVADMEPEAATMRGFLLEFGVAPEHILVDATSRNTAENCREAASLMRESGLQDALLVTSALHMPRALAACRSAGIVAQPSPTDFRVTRGSTQRRYDWLPDAAAQELVAQALREHLGLTYYRLRGWIHPEALATTQD